MARWDPDAAGRLQRAALALYLERGYEDVTVTQIAQRAGLAKRTFFRYFTDKREVLFAGAQTFQASVVTAVRDAADDLAPIEIVVTALAEAGAELTRYGQFARARRDLIASSTDLQERELIKTAGLITAVTQALRDRGTDPLRANMTAHAGVAAFTTAYDRWIDHAIESEVRHENHHDTDGDDALIFAGLVRESLDELRRAIGKPEPQRR